MTFGAVFLARNSFKGFWVHSAWRLAWVSVPVLMRIEVWTVSKYSCSDVE